MAKRLTKEQKVLNHLKRRGSLTSWDAIQKYGATRLAAMIHKFRDNGHKIETVNIETVDNKGVKGSYARYYYKSK